MALKTNGKAKAKTTFGRGRTKTPTKRVAQAKAKKDPVSNRKAIQKESMEKRERTYTITMSEHDRYWIMTKLERLGSAKTPHEKHLLDLIRNSKSNGGK